MTSNGGSADNRIVVDLVSIRRAHRRHDDGSEFWLELRTDRRSDEAFARVVADVNARIDANNHGGAQHPVGSPKGYVVLVDGFADRERLDVWLSAFVEQLEQMHFTGTLRAASEASWPKYFDSIQHDPVTDERITVLPEPTAFIVWSLDWDTVTPDRGTTSAWHVPDDATRRITEHLATWTAPGGPVIQLRRDVFSFNIDDSTQVAPILADAVAATAMARVLRYERRRPHGRLATLGSGGGTATQSIDPTATWPERIADLREVIVGCPDLMEQAFVRPSTLGASSWSNMRDKLALPGVSESDVRYNKHLLTEYVPDAHGVQVLRDKHLAHARDLSHWNISDLGHGRKLVEAKDLIPWYATPLPDPAVLEQARCDFGDMILTEAIVEANRSPS